MKSLHTFFSDTPLTYDGTQLRSHFAYDSFNILGDSIVSFIGPCNVPKEHLVDLEDVHQNSFIFSHSMLHFIVEHFGQNLITVIAWQRLLVDLIIQEMRDTEPSLALVRRGDDIYDDVCKVSVSIAAPSPVSCLIHTGINIESKDTPLPTKGLNDFGLNPLALATGVMNRYRAELDSLFRAQAKVRGCR